MENLEYWENTTYGTQKKVEIKMDPSPFKHKIIPEISEKKEEEKKEDKKKETKKEEKNEEKKEEIKKEETKEDKKVEKKEEKKEIEEKKVDKSSKQKVTKDGDISEAEIRVGKIISVKKHEKADTLFVEQIDLGEKEPRTICSGLYGKLNESDLQDKLVLVFCNLKPKDSVGILSFG